MNSSATIFQKLRRFVYQRCSIAKSVFKTIWFLFPKRFAAFVNNGLIYKLFNIPRFKAFQRLHVDEMHNHFYIIVMPNTLHFLFPCLRLIPNTVNVLLILNGVDAWEEEYLKGHCRDHSIFRLTTFCHSSISHGLVVNLLIDNNDSNFGILDHDLYVFNPTIFSRLKFEGDEFAIGVKHTYHLKGSPFPVTNFLFFNIDLLKKIRNNYRIGAQEYNRIPLHLEPQLASLRQSYPNHQAYFDKCFDTMDLLFALALYEKLSFKFLGVTLDDIYHIGETTYDYESHHPHISYIGLRFIELLHESTLTEHYSSLYDHDSASKKLISELHQNRYIASQIARFEKGFEKIEKRIGSTQGK
jgi:hypothetical protein